MERVLYVDLDGTIATSPISSVIREAYRRVAEASGLDLREVEAVSWSLHVELVKRSSPAAFDWDYIGREVSKALGVSLSLDIEGRFRELCHLSRLLDDAARVLAELRDMGWVLVLATNGLLKYQRCVIESLDLDIYFDEVITPDTRGCLKNSEGFYSIRGRRPSGISIGDSYTFDVYYPKRFGLRAIHVVRSSHDPYATRIGIEGAVEPDATIRSLGELPRLLKRF